MQPASNARPAVLITGANGGIGQALVLTFADAGYSVIATDQGTQSNTQPFVKFISADLQKTVEDESYADFVFSEIRSRLNGAPLTALINNAAVQVVDRVESLDRLAWRKTLDVNLLAPFFWVQALLPELIATRGCVLNISSIHARLTKPRFAAYATSKAALSGLTRSLAIEFGDRIRVNAIEPAAIDTPMLKAGFDEDDEGFKRLENYHPTKCIGSTEKIGELAKLIVEADSIFLNGAIIPFDGGIAACLHDPADQI